MADLFLCWIPSTTHINDLGEKHETRDSHHAEETNDWHHLSSLGKACLTIWVLCSHRKCQGSGPTDNVLHLLPDVVPKVLADSLGNANAVIAGVSVEKPAVSTAIIYTIFLFISNQAGTRSVQQTKTRLRNKLCWEIHHRLIIITHLLSISPCHDEELNISNSSRKSFHLSHEKYWKISLSHLIMLVGWCWLIGFPTMGRHNPQYFRYQ